MIHSVNLYSLTNTAPSQYWPNTGAVKSLNFDKVQFGARASAEVEDEEEVDYEAIEARRRAAKKKAFFDKAGPYIRKNTSRIQPNTTSLAPYRDLEALRSKQVNRLIDITSHNWLRHAYIGSDVPELTEGVLAGLVKKLPRDVRVIQLDSINPFLRELLSFYESYPGMADEEGLARIIKPDDASRLQEIFAATFKSKYRLRPEDKIVLLLKDIKLDRKTRWLFGLLEKTDLDIHIIGAGKSLKPERSEDHERPEYVERLMNAMATREYRINNIQAITIPSPTPEEWPTILTKTSNPIGLEAAQIMKRHGFSFTPDALFHFMGAIAIEYNEYPLKEDIFAELDQFGSFFDKVKISGQTLATIEDVQHYRQQELAKRPSLDFDPYEERAMMGVPNPFEVIKHPTTTFADVIGHKNAKRAIRSVLSPIKRALSSAGRDSDHSDVSIISLEGPPGTGKTELAKATAGEFNGTMITANAGNLINSFQASGPANVNRLKTLVQTASSEVVVVFLDEMDAVGSRDGMGMSPEERRTLNSLLSMLQGAGKRFNKTVLFMFATNKPESLDAALLDRIDRRIKVGPPDSTERIQLWQLHLKKLGVKYDNINWFRIAKMTEGYVGRNIKNMIKNLKSELIDQLPDDEQERIASDPTLLKDFKITATEADLIKSIQQYKDEHGAKTEEYVPGGII